MTAHDLAWQDAPVILARTITVDLRANILRIDTVIPGSFAPSHVESAVVETIATLDIGIRGRLLGLECAGADALRPFVLSIADPEPADLAVMRSVQIPIQLVLERSSGRLSATIARHGADYELAWPSGNQCWRRAGIGEDGEPIVTCAVLV